MPAQGTSGIRRKEAEGGDRACVALSSALQMGRQWAPPNGCLQIEAQVPAGSDIVICSTDSKFYVYLWAQFIFIQHHILLHEITVTC